MCLWCQVEQRAYRSYRQQERRALEEIRRIQVECPAEDGSGEDCPDRLRCLWEKKLEFVVARIHRERLARELAGQQACEGRGGGPRGKRSARKVPSPDLSHEILSAFERYIESLFERLAPGNPSDGPAGAGRKLVPFEGPGSSSR